MKTIYSILFFVLVLSLQAIAQPKATGKAFIKVPGLHCDLDKDRIERSLFKMYGIGVVKADVKKKTVTATWLTDRTNLESVKTAIANAGYDADDVTAEENAQKRLPVGCKYIPPVKEPEPKMDTVKIKPTTTPVSAEPPLIKKPATVTPVKGKVLVPAKVKTKK
jgi:periplasmic mercuric ion binding protein